MSAYRRNFVPGGYFFFTVNLAERRLALLTDIEVLRGAFRETHRRHPFTIDAIVVLPDHLHTDGLGAVCSAYPLWWHDHNHRKTTSR